MEVVKSPNVASLGLVGTDLARGLAEATGEEGVAAGKVADGEVGVCACTGAEMEDLAISLEEGEAVGELPPIPNRRVDRRLLPVDVRGPGRVFEVLLSR